MSRYDRYGLIKLSEDDFFVKIKRVHEENCNVYFSNYVIDIWVGNSLLDGYLD